MKANYSVQIFTVDGIRYLRIPELQELGLNHLFTTRDLDLRISGCTDPARLEADIAKVFAVMDQDFSDYFCMFQVHSKHVIAVDEPEDGIKIAFGRRLENCDGLMTGRQDQRLGSSYADCVPLLIYDPIKKVHANVHSGWRGTASGIGLEAIRGLEKNYGSRIEDLWIGVGPHIGPNDFEVRADVVEIFLKAGIPGEADYIRQKSEEHYLIDLSECLRRQFRAVGIRPERILEVGLSTVSNPDLLHSFRRDASRFGIMTVFSQQRK